MMHIVSFSGGVCSFWAAKRIVTRYGRQNVILLFADTLIEDPDLYRFNCDVETHLGLKLTRIADGRTPWQVFRDNHMIGNTHSDLCSRILKRELIWAWIQGHHFAFGPSRAVVHLGMDFSEFNRLAEVQSHNPDWEITAPMCEEPLWDKCRMLEELKPLGIRPPRFWLPAQQLRRVLRQGRHQPLRSPVPHAARGLRRARTRGNRHPALLETPRCQILGFCHPARSPRWADYPADPSPTAAPH